MSEAGGVIFINARSCGIYKNGGPRYKINPATGRRTAEIDNELLEQVEAYLKGDGHPGVTRASIDVVFNRQVLVPTYFDNRYRCGIDDFLESNALTGITVGELIDTGLIQERKGHGSPPNDQRSGHVPYIKVSDIRGLRINVNPTNLVTNPVATRYWGGESSGLQAWDLITPNRASSNIGEFAILVPGEERIVLTKEVFVFRALDTELFDPFYLIWAFSLKVVREQWRRITLMQTNREDCGNRYREIVIPKPPSKTWAREASAAFKSYFEALAAAKTVFGENLKRDLFEYVANVLPTPPEMERNDGDSRVVPGEEEPEQTGE